MMIISVRNTLLNYDTNCISDLLIYNIVPSCLFPGYRSGLVVPAAPFPVIFRVVAVFPSEFFLAANQPLV